MLAITRSISLVGLTGHLIDIEADIGNGVPGFTLLGLPDAALSEARDRVRSAISNSSAQWPNKRITLALSPAALPKRGSSFDCAIAIALLAAAQEITLGRIDGAVVLGELTLDGRIKSVPGILPALRAAALHGIERAIIPSENFEEGSLIPGINLIHFDHLRQLITWVKGGEYLPSELTRSDLCSSENTHLDFSDIAGQERAKEALEIGAVGGHHIAMVGPPGVGKSMLAARIPSILPRLTERDALDVTSLHSIAGKISPLNGSPLITSAPFVAPHHTISRAGLIGGGSATISPGACSLAHRGILFLDEAPEISRPVIESLREPMESGEVTLTRLGRSATFPARFTLVLASNPCPCGWAIGKAKRCTCSSLASRRYREKLSGPILDRVDLRIELEPLSQGDLARRSEPSSDIAVRVASARERSKERFSAHPWSINSEIPAAALRSEFAPEPRALSVLYRALDAEEITVRGLHRIQRVAWSIADLHNEPSPSRTSIDRAL
ncbi:MAG: ATP-binding protein, partial [Actinobacteria bacterium]|nr:ATP-binding protein [Candidatus Fonsibacter lacus]